MRANEIRKYARSAGMRTGRPIADLVITAEEKAALERRSRRPKSAQALARRSRIVLECAQGEGNTVVAQKPGVTKQTVGKWPNIFSIRQKASTIPATYTKLE
jgi:hypothetical protein